MERGKLIVLEGLDGSGKATQTGILCSEIRKYNRSVCRVSFPDYNEPSSLLVKMYLNSEFGQRPEDVNPYAAGSFYAVDRFASYMKFWNERYQRGQIIIADRYTTSNAVYQMGKLPQKDWDEYLNWLEDYEYCKLDLPRPDLVLYLDMPIEISQKFMTRRYDGKESKKDLHEKNIELLKKCREAALFAAEKLNWKILQCSKNNEPKSIDEIKENILNIVKGEILEEC